MRDIKFRAWNKNEKRMEDINFIRWVKYGYMSVNSIYYKNGKRIDNGSAYDAKEPSTIEVMQYINRKDKNGTEIYEGDILKSPDNELIEITYNSDTGGFLMEYIESNDFYNLEEFTEAECEIIGNIYKNPKLIMRKI